MPTKQPTKNTKRKNLLEEEIESVKSSASTQKNRGAKTVPAKRKPGRPKGSTTKKKSAFPAGSRPTKTHQYVMSLTAEVTASELSLAKPKQMVTAEMVIDDQKNVFKMGTVTIVTMEAGKLPHERVQVLEAEEVEILCKLFGIVRP